MNSMLDIERDEQLAGHDSSPGIVAVEHESGTEDGDKIRLYVIEKDGSRGSYTEQFRPFIWMTAELAGQAGKEAVTVERLDGPGVLDRLVFFSDWKSLRKAGRECARLCGKSASSAAAPFLVVNDPVQQYLMLSGRTQFGGMRFEDLRRMQVDIECIVTEGFEFCNPERSGDRIAAIGYCADGRHVEILADDDEKLLLERFVEAVQQHDPDVIEGHNFFNFDMNYLYRRAVLHKVPFRLGRNGRLPTHRSSRFSAAERVVQYERWDVPGRHIIDTMFLSQLYDISFRALGGFGLKAVARHFGLAAENRTYIDAGDIPRLYRENPERLLAYLKDDVIETRRIADLLSRSYFAQVQLLPYSYQNTAVRGNATKIDALLIREYLYQRHSLPQPDQQHKFEGGYADMFVEGVVYNVRHCDVRSLYPSLMLSEKIVPCSDELKVFPALLKVLKTFRLKAKAAVNQTDDAALAAHYDALQATFKILINSFYGYLGFSQGRFCDFDAAAEVTRKGRELLRWMIEWLNNNGARPVEIDTDGVYYVPPELDEAGEADFRRRFIAALPDGIEIEFDGSYAAMFSYKMKNYALLCHDGEMIIKGAALKSRGMELFQRRYLEEILRLRLEGRDKEIHAVTERYRKAIRNSEWPIEMFAKKETLQESPEAYQQKRRQGRKSRSAAYELASASEREYRAGDQIAYYVTGNRKSVTVHESARLTTEWREDMRDENIAYYEAKLEALGHKFGETDMQPELF